MRRRHSRVTTNYIGNNVTCNNVQVMFKIKEYNIVGIATFLTGYYIYDS